MNHPVVLGYFGLMYPNQTSWILSYLVEHQFEVVVEDIRGLSVFGNTVWGETDCFVQYHFPHQKQSYEDEEDEGVC